jgi:hypothetical protein
MFYLPNWLWKTLHRQSGVDLNTAIADAQCLRTMHSCDRAKVFTRKIKKKL